MSDDPITRILDVDQRYDRHAYMFVREALQRTVMELGERRHVTAAELLDGIRATALEHFGPLARTVLAQWGVETTGDFGNVVFNLVDAGELGKNDDDDPTDFENVFDFDDAFTGDLGDLGDVRIVVDEDE